VEQVRPVASAALALAACALVAPAAAQAIKCRGDAVVSVGDSPAAVLQKCGDPAARNAVCRPLPAASAARPASAVRPGQIVPCENVDEWIYNASAGQAAMTMRFVEGKLSAVETATR
jgi:hypothetical protein